MYKVLLVLVASCALLVALSLAAPPAAAIRKDAVVLNVASQSTARLIGAFVIEKDLAAWCPQEQPYGVRFTWIAIPWYIVQPYPPTQRDYDWRYTDGLINAAHNCGLDIGVHILSRSTWATLPQPEGSDPAHLVSMPPQNLDDYANFVHALAARYRGMISRYSIENEAHASTNWPSSPESYFQMLPVAYQAIHSADPDALVEDAALSSSALGVLVTHDMLQRGDAPGALAYWQSYYSEFRTNWLRYNTADKIQAFLNTAEMQRTVHWADLLYANTAYYDVQQLHYFAPWSNLTTVTDWVHGQLIAHGGDKPLDFWETGYGWDDPATLDTQRMAQEQIKTYATAFGEGALRVVQHLFNDYDIQDGHPGLVQNDGTPKPPATSFKLFAEKLNGATSARRLDLGSSAWGYQFDTPSGPLIVAWSRTGEAQIVGVPLDTPTVDITHLDGARSGARSNAVTLSASPIIVQAAAAPASPPHHLFLPFVRK